MRIPRQLEWLFPDQDLTCLEPERDARAILGRVLEEGRMQDVRWCVQYYGLPRIHRFFREGAHSDISPKTIALWRAALNASHEHWRAPRRSRLRSVAPWPG